MNREKEMVSLCMFGSLPWRPTSAEVAAEVGLPILPQKLPLLQNRGGVDGTASTQQISDGLLNLTHAFPPRHGDGDVVVSGRATKCAL